MSDIETFDHCKNCGYRGHIEECLSAPCVVRESWYAKTAVKIKLDKVREAVEKLDYAYMEGLLTKLEVLQIIDQVEAEDGV